MSTQRLRAETVALGDEVLTAPGTESFVQLLTNAQSRLYAYISTLVPDFVSANEILSATNSTLWIKAKEYQSDRDFERWAVRIAYFEVLAHQKRRRRDRHVFDGQLLEDLAEAIEAESESLTSKRQALHTCIQKLSRGHKRLVQLRYDGRMSVQQIAEQDGKTPNAISSLLFRIHSVLADCIDRTLGMEST